MKKEEQILKLIAELKTGDTEVIDQTIEQISETGDSSFIVKLADFLVETDNQELKHKILTLFGELKHSDAVEQLIYIIQTPKYSKEQLVFVACCWQNGLNYSQHLPYFVDLIIEKDFETAFEAFTVVENMYGKIDTTVEIETLHQIKKALNQTNEQKEYLLNGLLQIIPNIPELREDISF